MHALAVTPSRVVHVPEATPVQVLTGQGRWADAEAVLLGQIEAEAGPGRLASAAATGSILGAMYVKQGRLSEAWPHLRLGRRHAAPDAAYVAVDALGWLRLRRSRPAAAQDQFVRLRDLNPGRLHCLCMSHIGLAACDFLRARSGDPEAGNSGLITGIFA